MCLGYSVSYGLRPLWATGIASQTRQKSPRRRHSPNGGLADSLDEATAAFRAAGAAGGRGARPSCVALRCGRPKMDLSRV